MSEVVEPEEHVDVQPEAVRRPEIRVRLGRLLAELVIVFIGVYAAFALNEYRAAQAEELHRAQIRDALLSEIEDIVFRTKRVSSNMPQQVAALDSLIAAGARPPLSPMLEPVRMEAHMWEATLQSGGLNLLDVETLYQISAFYNILNAGFEQLGQMRYLSETVLLPNLNAGPDEFYDPETGALQPKYQWYIYGLRRMTWLAEEATQQGEQLLTDLKVDG